MKKVISVSLIVALLFAFTACSSKEYKDIPVTDENGQTVTDENGDVVTERIKADKDSEDEQESSDTSTGTTAAGGQSDSDSQNSSNNSGSSGSGSGSTAGNSGSGTTQVNNNKETTTANTTTAKPKKRDIDVSVVLPFYNNEETKLTVYYMVDGDKKYTKLETRDVELKDYKFGKEEKFVIENVKGKVTVKVEFEGITITNDTEEVAANEDSVKIKPVTGIEIMEGGWD